MRRRMTKSPKLRQRRKSSEGGKMMNNGSTFSVNKAIVTGKVIGEIKESHKIFGEKFYEFTLEVPRLSSVTDLLPVTVSERLLMEGGYKEGNKVTVRGQFRSYNKNEGERSKLILTVFAREMGPGEGVINSIELAGYICKAPVYRTTPFNREICDILLAVNRSYGKSDYIPAIAWGRNARFVKYLSVGEQVAVTGRIQSRIYQKRIGEDETEERTAYEVSVGKVLAGDSAVEFMRAATGLPGESAERKTDDLSEITVI